MADPAAPPAAQRSPDSVPKQEPSQAPPDPAFERWRRKAAGAIGYGLSPEDEAKRAEMKRLEQLDNEWTKCQKWKNELMRNSPAVVFMTKQLGFVSTGVTPAHILCMPCHQKLAGGFSPHHGILLCQDGFMNKKHMEDTLVHEMVHMYDHAKFNVDWHNIRHHACSEIRAASLSGDCRWGRELRRGKYTFTKQHQDCVRRRAVLSVKANPACPDEAAAEKAVNEVWESCFKDTRPFDEIY